ncbi:LOW QUALITY PROTEIN: hypothetical protein T265_12973 [Opisthorchis viverrini]|uniref:Uncharacterized protein n=1 Tax=Opisthorchis viverrini TaxID=6198 RepID=A0A075A6W3_OPIVI|nr:LOW QUALITY PROTEIN: hypothetical protein T265_12973 [Opisthorchis viverrini]KER31395.1 LOW QUALITY PROTEIN: hypothetical protein T265_12973 [Opisthorchis viverrini]
MHAMEAPGDSDSPKAGVHDNFCGCKTETKLMSQGPQGCTSPILTYESIKMTNTVYYTGLLFEEHRPRCTMAYVNRPVLVVWCVKLLSVCRGCCIWGCVYRVSEQRASSEASMHM